MSNLIKQFQTSQTTKLQLICFPFAGGNAVSYNPLNNCLSRDINLFAIEPPGHGTNRMSLIEKFDSLVDIYLNELNSIITGDFALFGHSMGGLLTYRIAQRLEQQKLYPKAIIISAARPPQIGYEDLDHLNDNDFINYLVSLGGISSEFLREKELLEYFLPIFRADYRALKSFDHTDHTIIESPVHIFNGREDQFCFEKQFGWRKWAKQIKFYNFSGGHMYLLSNIEEVAKQIQMILKQE
ncbi:thioesterase II family protein [Bacillus mycoides]|uniref:thioesterase II family protein n=1 Tax=Bacillus mycoides TaxID=1405 RepID=UPI0018CE805B|nr:alpha/beta fold hydrolase [Bacillus mycoides]MBG9687412.1 thioesterase [Bacillus mycoides]QWI36299.1 thioesterase [Bacillus mycoides]